jgi:hypothetical protein
MIPDQIWMKNPRSLGRGAETRKGRNGAANKEATPAQVLPILVQALLPRNGPSLGGDQNQDLGQNLTPSPIQIQSPALIPSQNPSTREAQIRRDPGPGPGQGQGPIPGLGPGPDPDRETKTGTSPGTSAKEGLRDNPGEETHLMMKPTSTRR